MDKKFGFSLPECNKNMFFQAVSISYQLIHSISNPKQRPLFCKIRLVSCNPSHFQNFDQKSDSTFPNAPENILKAFTTALRTETRPCVTLFCVHYGYAHYKKLSTMPECQHPFLILSTMKSNMYQKIKFRKKLQGSPHWLPELKNRNSSYSVLKTLLVH